MKTSWKRVVASLAVLLLAVPAVQAAGHEPLVDRYVRATVSAEGDGPERVVEGTVIRETAETIVLNGSVRLELPRSRVWRLEERRDGDNKAGQGLLIGLGVGFGLGAFAGQGLSEALCRGQCGEEVWRVGLVVAPVGGVLGLLIGALFHGPDTWHVIRHEPPRQRQVSLLAAHDRVALRLSF